MRPPPPLLASFKETLRRRQAQSARRSLTLAPPDSVDFSSNDFLSLSKSPDLRDAFIAEFARLNHLPLGSGGSRLLDGNSAYAEALEHQIAAFHAAPNGLLFNSGFDANSGFFACVPQPGDVVLFDQYIHASVHEGMRLSRAGLTSSFRHNSVQHLRSLLEHLLAKDELLQTGRKNLFVAVEAVYSMDGDVAPIVALLDQLDALFPLGNAHLIVDEAHSNGVYGRHGRGIVCDLGVEKRVFARLHTFGKALSANGAILLCDDVTKDYLVNYARSLIYTTAMGLPSLAMTKAVYSFLQAGRSVDAQRHLWHLTQYFHDRLRSSLPDSTSLALYPSPPKSPIFSLLTNQPRSLATFCQSRGYVVRPIVPPTVPEGGERVRVCLHAGNTEAHIDGLVAVVCEWVMTQHSGSMESSKL